MVDPGSFLAGRTRETQIRRDARGRWWNGDDPITHVLLTRAFDSWIARAEDGRLCLSNDINWAYVTIEGAPVFVRSAEIEGDAVMLSLSDGRREPLDPATLREGDDGALYCQVRGGTLAALLESHAAVALDPLVAEDGEGVYLALGSRRVRPPRVVDPLAFPIEPRSERSSEGGR